MDTPLGLAAAVPSPGASPGPWGTLSGQAWERVAGPPALGHRWASRIGLHINPSEATAEQPQVRRCGLVKAGFLDSKGKGPLPTGLWPVKLNPIGNHWTAQGHTSAYVPALLKHQARP